MEALVLLLELIKEHIKSENRVGYIDFSHYAKIINGIDDSISEFKSLQNENKSLVKTLEKYNEEMIELRKVNQDLLNTIIEAQESIKNILEGIK